MEQVSASSASGNSSKPKFQKYALRSSTKSKDLNPDAPNSSHSNRRSSPSSVSKSVSVLDLSGKDKSGSVKPPRRYSSVQAKLTATPSPKMVGNNTPISETRSKRNTNSQGPQTRNQTPISDIFRTSSRVRFNLLSSPSYWLNQIKLSESASKHSISLGFFKLALEAGCEKMQDELKSYVQRNQLVAELGEQVKELFELYNIAESLEQSQVSEAISQVPEDGTRSSDDEMHCSSKGTGNLKPKSLNTDCTQLTPVTTELTKKKTCQKNKQSQSDLREKLRMKSANSRPAFESGNLRSVKKQVKPTKHDSSNKKKSAVKIQGPKSIENEVPVSPSSAEDNVEGNKENMDVLGTDVTTEVV